MRALGGVLRDALPVRGAGWIMECMSTPDEGFQIAVWSQGEAVLAQVYDRQMHPVNGPRPVATHADVQQIMDEFGVPPGRWDRTEDAVRLLDGRQA